MIRKQEQLFQLIKSLSKEEKRHFKLYSGKYRNMTDNNYLKLFNAIDKQDVYDEVAIKEQFSGEAFVRQLTVTKYYLQKQIIRSLQDLHYEETVGLTALSLHHQIAILYRKGHYEICRDLVRKGIELSSENELFLEWIGFLKRELDLINKTDVVEYRNSLEKYLENTSQLLNWYEITTQGNHLANQLQIFALDTPTFGYYNTHYESLIVKIENLILKIEINLLPLKTRFNLLFPLAQSYLAVNNYKKALEVFVKIFNELRNDFKTRELHEQYLNTLLGLIYASGAMNDVSLTQLALDELINFPEVNQHIGFRKAEGLAFYPLFTSALSGNCQVGQQAIHTVETFLQNYAERIPVSQYIYAYYYSAYIHLACGNYALALKYLRKTDAHHKKDLLPNMQLAIRIMETVIFLEQGKFELLESRFRSLQRQLQNNEDVKKFLRCYVKYFQKLILPETTGHKTKALYTDFLNELLQMPVNEQISMYIHFDLISWLQSIILGCTLGECLQINAARLFGHNS